MLTFNLVDSSFAHDVGTTAGRQPKLISWDKALTHLENPTFFTHEKIFAAPLNGGNNFALLFESKAIIPQIYQHAHLTFDRFRAVFTHNPELISIATG